MLEYLMLGNVHAWKYSKTGARTRSILKKFAFDTTLLIANQKLFMFFSYLNPYLVLGLLRHVLAKVWKASKTRRKESWPLQLTYHLIRKVFVRFEIECYEWLQYDEPKWQWVLGKKNRLIVVYPFLTPFYE